MSEVQITVKGPKAAKMLDVSMPVFYELAALEGFPAFRKGGMYLVNVEKLREWANENIGKTIP